MSFLGLQMDAEAGFISVSHVKSMKQKGSFEQFRNAYMFLC